MSATSLDRLTCASSADLSEIDRVFSAEGVVVLKNTLPDHIVRSAREFLNEALSELERLFARSGIPTSSVSETGAAIADLLKTNNGTLEPADRHVLLGHFPLETRLDPILQDIPKHMSTLPQFQHLVGSEELFVHMPPTARFVMPGNLEAAVPPHQDVSYNKHLGPFRVMWVPLTEIDRKCGGMAVYPKSHQQGEVFDGPNVASTDGWLDAVDPDGFERLELVPLSPGDVVIMTERTIHESMANISDRIRLSVDFRVFGAHSHSDKHYLDLQTGDIVAPSGN